MNYISKKLGGEDRGFKLGIGFLRFLDENGGIKFNQLDEILRGGDVLKYPVLVYNSLMFNAFKSKTEFKHDQYDVDEWIDEAGGLNGEFMLSFVEALLKSIQVDSGKTQPQGKGAKK